MSEFSKPTIVVSKCLEFAPVRYNGMVIPDRFVRELKEHVDFIPVCPEVEIGLGVPRKPIRIVDYGEGLRLIQPETGADFTEKMEEFSERFLSGLPEVDGFIMKSRSPSSGIKDVKIYPGLEKVAATGKGPGFFGGKIIEKFAPMAIEDEGRLTNFELREAFLTRVFTHADFRRVKRSGKMKDLVAFQAASKLLLMAYNQKEMKELGRITANREKKGFAEVAEEYEEHLNLAMAKTPRKTSIINVLMHAMGYFKRELTAKEKAYFLDLMEKYRKGNLPLSSLQSVLYGWIVKYENEYLETQTFFRPFPEGLVLTRDSGKGVQK